jgi:uncharacterized protein (DUF433 family)
MANLLDRISINPKIGYEQPRINGTRIMVGFLVQYITNGDYVEEVLAEYLSLPREDIQACLICATEVTREGVLPVEVSG